MVCAPESEGEVIKLPSRPSWHWGSAAVLPRAPGPTPVLEPQPGQGRAVRDIKQEIPPRPFSPRASPLSRDDEARACEIAHSRALWAHERAKGMWFNSVLTVGLTVCASPGRGDTEHLAQSPQNSDLQEILSCVCGGSRAEHDVPHGL